MADPSNDEGFEEWARKMVSVEGLSAEERARKLEGSAHWQALDHHWSRRLAEELRRGRMDHATRYAELLAEELGRRGQLPPASGAGVGEVRIGPPSSRSGAATPFDDLDDELSQTNRVPRSRGPADSFRALATSSEVPRPDPGQTHTAVGVLSGRGVDELRAINEAMAWTVEQYARYRSDLLHAQDAQSVLERHSLHVGKAKQRVEEAWSRRLNEDPALLRRYEAAFEALES